MSGHRVEFSTRQANPNHAGVDDIDPKEVWSNREKVTIVDVRRPDEFTGELGHVPGSRLVVLDNLPQQLDELPKDQTIVLVCRSGARSGRAADFMHGQGFESVYNMKGGMILWNEMALPVEGRNEG